MWATPYLPPGEEASAINAESGQIGTVSQFAAQQPRPPSRRALVNTASSTKNGKRLPYQEGTYRTCERKFVVGPGGLSLWYRHGLFQTTSTVPLLLEPDLDLVRDRRQAEATETTAFSVHGTDDQASSFPFDPGRSDIEEDKHKHL